MSISVWICLDVCHTVSQGHLDDHQSLSVVAQDLNPGAVRGLSRPYGEPQASVTDSSNVGPPLDRVQLIVVITCYNHKMTKS